MIDDFLGVSPTITQNTTTGTVTVTFNAPAAGTYFISIKYSAQCLAGAPSPGNNRSLQLRDDERAWFDRWPRSIPRIITQNVNSPQFRPPSSSVTTTQRRLHSLSST